ncbi:hypothetical protein [Aeromonas phage 4L372D]|uniref:Uncharacterized protein n=2 Tax=Plateaulakevirus TaxID=2843436 RepID=A0A5B9N3B4_9CAUD|nr:hypothetical protein HWC27_gp064 [Aeromonas phage 4L372D]YP_009846838.1 hypothetical protein HWC28_gp039 [Aeromonas phage 4L372XY]QEG08528.1 hypothetical protein [Aeromonas phage 4L372D]QEG08754.1 hypothetical protein [Aeromonas phage 4L372XY]
MLLYNAIKCPDGTLLVSRHQHDFQMHIQQDGREYFVDGGLLHQRIGYSDNKYTNLCVYSDDSHEKIREHFEWTRSFDKEINNLPQPETIKLKDITDDHLMALVEWTNDDVAAMQLSSSELNRSNRQYPKEIHKVFVDELEYRKQ